MDKKKTKKSKVGPLGGNEFSDHVNSGYEMDFVEEKNNTKVLNSVRDKVKSASPKMNAISAIIDAKKSASKWRDYTASKRIRKRNISGDDENEERKIGGIGLDELHDSFACPSRTETNQKMSSAGNRSLLAYFAKLGHSSNPDEMLDLDFVDSLLNHGASINTTDKHGQTLLHEVARTWHIDVAKFLLEHNADVNKVDDFGRSPLHVAAAVDYPEMVVLLIENGAKKEAKTKDENQTPVHYAAKNDACGSLRTLIKLECNYKTVRDYKERTPLHLAAELDRSETARLLLDYNASVGVMDKYGNKALSWMITKMPPVAMDALNQFHTTDRPNRKQYFYLNLLVQDREKDPEGHAQIPGQAAVTYKQYDLLMHKVFIHLFDIQWARFARWRAWLNLLLNFIYIILWSVIGVLVEYDKRHLYILPDDAWRIVLWLAALGFTAWQIVEEVLEYKRSLRIHNISTKRREESINEDLKFCHPRWPEEEAFLRTELEDLDKLSPKYFSDYWNIFDWFCYAFLVVCIATHFADIISHTEELARQHIRIMAVTIILLWIRLMKIARAFSLLGPFIVMLAHMTKDLLRFVFLYLVFYLPFVCAFWMMFGGDKIPYASRGDTSGNAENVTVKGYEEFGSVFFSLFRLTVVDDYDYDGMKDVDPVMTDILVGFWIALSAILMLNLFIALLSDTFQRVYDNAQANAVMQKAITILNIWEGMSKSSRDKFLDHIKDNCAPLVEYYDDDMTEEGEEDLKKVTIQVKDQLDELQEMWENKFNSPHGLSKWDDSSESVVTVEKFENEIQILREGITELRVRQDDMMDRLKSDTTIIKSLLLEILGRPGDGGGLDSFGMAELGDGRQRSRSKGKKKKKKTSKFSLEDPTAALTDTPVSVSSVQPGLTSAPMVDVSTADFSAASVPQLAQQADPMFRGTFPQMPGQDPSTEC